ncbi:MAG: OmcA/MtrC family decaheme c-type cytochrome [Gammaproteobacteria bacterium]
MNWLTGLWYWIRFILVVSAAVIATGGCLDNGDDGKDGAAGPPGPPGTPAAVSATELNITITDVTISSPPVVSLSVTNEDGVAFTGITDGQLAFTIAKLTPSVQGDSSAWQNYINREETATVGPGTGNSAIQGTRESNGTLVDNGDGTYTYTFATDITNVTTPLTVPYDPSLTHRVAIQVGGGLPVANPIYDFRPSDGATTGISTREIVKIETCNGCHNKLALHGSGRIDTKYCVTCHNPGSTDANSGNTVDFKVMIHKIHRGAELHTVEDGGEYAIWGYRDTKHDYSTVEFPQDIRNCTNCHDGSDPDTPDGDNWKTQPTMEACGSCHDDVDFSAGVAGGHPGGVMTDNSECITCHAEGRIAGSVEESHDLPEQAARATFKYNILEICGTPVGSDPVCAPGTAPVVKFSVTDPTAGDAPYNVSSTTGDPEFTSSSASLNILVAWDTADYNNAGGGGTRPARAASINARTSAVDNGDGTFTVTTDPIPAGVTGSGAIGMEGHPAADFDGDDVYSDRVAAKGEVAYFRITDATVKARRQVVDNDKCNACHQQLNLHGSNRNGEVALCVLCHNPNNTDIHRRPKDGAGAVDVAATVDSKREESVDFRVMIHGIHAAAETNFDGSEGHGFRERGYVAYGFGGSAHDYGHVRFPGILNDCETCHLSGTYELDGTWESPTANGILATTTDAAPTATDSATLDAERADPSLDLNTSPTAAVCSSCHDDAVARAHMELNGGVFGQTQGVISATVIETCSFCHSPGSIADVEVVHLED